MTTFEGVSAVFGRRLKQLRKQQGLSAVALGARCAELDAPEVNEQVIWNIEQGRREPRLSNCVILAVALSVPLSALVVPDDPDDDVALTSRMRVQASRLSEWVAGRRPLPHTDASTYAVAASELHHESSPLSGATVQARAESIARQLDHVADDMAKQLATRFRRDIAAFFDSLNAQAGEHDSGKAVELIRSRFAPDTSSQ